ncbi:MAG TPA: hypothetical protein VKH18_07215 [Terriglobales bacterium]|nr:hypothetical protein [Terriglobales bacterium]
MRSRFLLSFLTFSVAAYLPLQAQINGVPPSVTSIGFGGRFINGVRPSVTSLGPDGYGNDWFVLGNCCSNFLLPENAGQPLSSGRQHRRKNKDHDHADFAVGVIEPVYVPYAVPSAQEAADDASDVDYVHAPGPPNQDAPARRPRYRDSVAEGDAYAKPSPGGPTSGEPEEPVATQPSTVLVFKDGHQSDVLNYAIVGDTLFNLDLAAGRTRKILLADLDLPATHKANDDRGVDFQIPASTARQ